MADRIIERENSNGVLWAVLGIAAIVLVAWFVWSAANGSPGVPNTGSAGVQVQTPAQ